MEDLIASFDLNIEEIIDDLRIDWMNHKDYNFNTTAFTKGKYSGDNFMCNCPFHSESSPSFGILTIHPYTWQCFGCDSRGNILHLIQHVHNLPSVVHAERYLMKHYIDVEVETRSVLDIDAILDSGDDHKVSLLESELDAYKGKRHQYLYGRGFNEKTLARYEIGYDSVNRQMIIPVRTSAGNIRFLKKRSIDSKRFDNATGIYKKDILYGLFYILQAMGSVDELFLTESETDAMACYQGKLFAASVMGRILFKEQVNELLKAGVRVVNLFYDNDLRGQEAVFKSYEVLKYTPIKINVVKYPYHFGIDTLDPEDPKLTIKDANNMLVKDKFKSLEVISFEEFIMLVSKSKRSLEF